MSNNVKKLDGFSKLDRPGRFAKLLALGYLTQEDIELFNQDKHPPVQLAEKLIENVLGYFPIPLGLAVNFRIDKKDYVIPMAVEETSIVAAASKTAKWVCQNGSITTEMLGQLSIGQIQIAIVNDLEKLQNIFLNEKNNFITELNQSIAKGLVARGGGVKDIILRIIARPDGKTMAIFHIHVDTCDAMGANIIVQICEYLKKPIEYLSGERVTMCILSNLNDEKLVRATVKIHDIEKQLAHDLVEASLFAELDPYRAATNNKGVLNGMDGILIATGNDWRAVEAGVHAYAAKDGQYKSITNWRLENNTLIGTLVAPIPVGIVGGVTQLHPTAKACLKLLNIENANELARVVAAVGLIQNLGAIKALTTFGFIEGHMKLHIDNLTLSAGASETEMPIVKKRLEQILFNTKRVSLNHAIEVLTELRQA